MSAPQFTPGPWSITPHAKFGPTHMYWVNNETSVGTQIKADVQLISAAPELYAALEKAAPFVGWASTRDQIIAGVRAEELCDVIDAALAKARGDQ